MKTIKKLETEIKELSKGCGAKQEFEEPDEDDDEFEEDFEE